MSPHAALLYAVRAQIRSMLGADGIKMCDIRVDGQPPPAAGQHYYAVFPSGVNGRSQQPTYREETYGVFVTYTRKMGGSPNDRIGPALLIESGEMLDRADAIIQLIHGNYDTISTANGQLQSATSHAFHHPLIFRGAGKVELKSADWFFADIEQASPPSGLAVTMRFEDATYTRGPA